MREVIIVEKPESISFQQIHDLIYSAHENNRANGIVVSTTKLDAKGIQNYLGKSGKCYVALIDGKLVGTTSYRILSVNAWYYKGPVLDKILVAVDPEYQGQKISTILHKKLEDQATFLGIKVMTLDTQEENKAMRANSESLGFKYVDYYRSKRNTKHYCVHMVKWLDNQPFMNWYLNSRFKLKRMYIRIIEFFNSKNPRRQ